METSSVVLRDRDVRLVLGFDAGCMTCSDLATRIEETVGDKLEIRSLHDPLVEYWRGMTFGKEAPWVPTLFEVRGDKVKAWTGTMMGVRLGRALGPVVTWRILQILGESRTVRVGGIATEQRTRMNVGISRGQFLKGLARIIHERLRRLPKERTINFVPDGPKPDAGGPS